MNIEELTQRKQKELDKCTILNNRINQNKAEVRSMENELLMSTGYIKRLDEEIKELEQKEQESNEKSKIKDFSKDNSNK